MNSWDGEVNYVRAWLYIECTYFLSWIMCGMVFLFFAYIFKFKSVAKDEEVMRMDDNVWNDKNTDDFLRYLKFEFFVLNYMMTFLLHDLVYGFQMMPFMSKYHHKLLKIFGVADFQSTGYVFMLFVGCRAMHLLTTAYRFHKG